MTAAKWDFPWRPAVAGALIFTVLRMGARQVAGEGISLDAVLLTLLLGAVTGAAVAFVVAPKGEVSSRAKAMRRALLFCVVPCAAVAGGAGAGDVDSTRAALGILTVLAGSLAVAWLTASRGVARR